MTDQYPASTPQTPAEPPQGRRRSRWIWASAGLGVVAVGLLVWALSLRSDLDGSQDDVAALQTQVDQGKSAGTEAVEATKDVVTDLNEQVGTTSADLEATQQDLGEAEQAAAKAQEDAAAAKDAAAEADSEADRAEAQAEEADAKADEATSRSRIAADCAKAYVSALGTLFEGDGPQAQAPDVRRQLDEISEQCRAALG